MRTNPNRQAKVVAFAFITMLAASQIQAQTASEDELWELSVGAKVAHYPKYMGSKNSETLVLPLIEGYLVLGESTTLFSSDFTLGLDWQITQPISTGLLATGRLGRDSSDSKVLAGMDDIDDTLEIGAYITWEMHPTFAMDLAVLTDTGNTYKGWLAELTARWGYIVVSDSIVVVTSATLTYGDARFNDTYYGVDPDEVSTNRLAYRADAGVNQAELSIELQYSPVKHWRLSGSLDLYQLYGDAADSPIVENKTQFVPTLSASYVF
jgi:outer membrane protein